MIPNDAGFSPLSSSLYGIRHLFQGREWLAEVRLNDHRFRYYSPELQRWLSRDSLQEQGGLNLYTFTLNGPTLYTDPTGEIAPIIMWLFKLGLGVIALTKFDLETQKALLAMTLLDIAKYKEDKFLDNPLLNAESAGSKGKCLVNAAMSLIELGADLTGKLIVPILPKPDLGPDITNPVSK